MERPRERILVPVDFGEPSHYALLKANELASRLDAEIIALHVHFPPVVAYPEIPATLVERLSDESESAARRSLEEIAVKNPGVRTLLRRGEPDTEILATIEAEKPTMVIMGTHGRRGLRRLFMGSVAERIIAKSPVPVMTIRAPEPAS